MTSSNYSAFSLLRTTISPSGIATVRITNPPMNIINLALLDEYTKLVPMLAKDRNVKVVVFKSGVEKWHMAHFDGWLFEIGGRTNGETELN